MKKIFAIMAAAAALFTMASCDMLDDDFIQGNKYAADSATPSKAAESGFDQKVPDGDAWDIDWDFERTYWEVDFKVGKWPNVTEYTMYFDLDGNWLGTRTEVRLKDVPDYIKDAFKASEYGNARLDDNEVDYYQTPSSEFYRFEIEINGRDVEIDVDLDGKVTLVGYDN